MQLLREVRYQNTAVIIRIYERSTDRLTERTSERTDGRTNERANERKHDGINWRSNEINHLLTTVRLNDSLHSNLVNQRTITEGTDNLSFKTIVHRLQKT